MTKEGKTAEKIDGGQPRDLPNIAAQLRTLAVPVESLRLDERNARKHSEENLRAIVFSLSRYGQQKPIVVDRDGVVIAGNGTLAAARSLGWSWIAASRTDLAGEEAKAFAIADNRTAELAEWENETLATILAELPKDTMEGIGFSEKDFAQLLAGITPTIVEDVVPEPPEIPISKIGDLWILGDHRVLCGDSFNGEDVKRLVVDGSVDLIVTDPPYAIYGSSTGVGSDIADDKMVRPFFESLGRTFASLLPYFGHAYVCCDWRSWSAVSHGMKAGGLSAKNVIVWDKGDFGLGNMYRQCHEFIGFFSRDPVRDSHYKAAKTGARQVLEPNVKRMNRTGQSGFEGTNEKGQRFHNAAKPVDLMAWFIANSSGRGDVVLDLFGGSGTTLLSAEQSGRKARIMEISPSYVDVIVKRWQTLTGGRATLEDGTPFPT